MNRSTFYSNTVSKIKTFTKVRKMITKMEHSKLNIFPVSCFGHLGSIEILQQILYTDPTEAEVRKTIVSTEKQLAKLLLKKKTAQRMNFPRDKKIWKLEGEIQGCKWYLGDKI